MKVIALIGEGNAGVTKGREYVVDTDLRSEGGVILIDDNGDTHLLSNGNFEVVEED